MAEDTSEPPAPAAPGDRHQKAGGKKGIKDHQIIALMRKHGGYLTNVAKALKVDLRGLERRVQNNPQLLQEQIDAERRITDVAASNVILCIKGELGSPSDRLRYSTYWLDRKGRAQGFGDRREHSGPGGGPIPVAGNHNVTAADITNAITPEEMAIARRRYIDGGDDPGAEGA